MFLPSLTGSKIHRLPSIWLEIMGTLPVLICNVLTSSVTSPRGAHKATLLYDSVGIAIYLILISLSTISGMTTTITQKQCTSASTVSKIRLYLKCFCISEQRFLTGWTKKSFPFSKEGAERHFYCSFSLLTREIITIENLWRDYYRT